jgi:hypothetical protein
MMSASTSNSHKKNLFICYSHADEAIKDELIKHLAALRRGGFVSYWHDRQIAPGDDWDEQIKQQLNNADIIIPLISSDFLASEYCIETEMVTALRRHESGEARLIPVIIRPCDWQTMSFSKIQALPKDAKAISQWVDKDAAILDVVNGIKRMLLTPSIDKSNDDSALMQDKVTYREDTVICLLPRGYVEIHNLNYQPNNWDIYATYYHYDGEEIHSTHYATEYYKKAWQMEYKARESQLYKLMIPAADHRFAHHIIYLMISLGSRKKDDKVSDIIKKHIELEGGDVYFREKGKLYDKPLMPQKYAYQVEFSALLDVIYFLENVRPSPHGLHEDHVRAFIESEVRDAYLFLENRVGGHFFLDMLRKMIDNFNPDDDYDKIIAWSKRVKGLLQDAANIKK